MADFESDPDVIPDGDADDDRFEISEPVGFEDSMDDFNTPNANDTDSIFGDLNMGLGPANLLDDDSSVSFKPTFSYLQSVSIRLLKKRKV